ncbi:hypothetical protein GGR54DRAFT_611335 [Hypoxylon sp. NC1633]|nr:hypothetical protein GGR54DRAFT_611335 [Hypoxylon sp. NC1633]
MYSARVLSSAVISAQVLGSPPSPTMVFVVWVNLWLHRYTLYNANPAYSYIAQSAGDLRLLEGVRQICRCGLCTGSTLVIYWTRPTPLLTMGSRRSGRSDSNSIPISNRSHLRPGCLSTCPSVYTYLPR